VAVLFLSTMPSQGGGVHLPGAACRSGTEPAASNPKPRATPRCGGYMTLVSAMRCAAFPGVKDFLVNTWCLYASTG